MQQKQYKIVLLGSPGVGKSSLTNRFIHNQFSPNMTTTLGAVYFQKQHIYGPSLQKKIKLQFWDTAGQQKFRAIAKIYYKDAHAALLMYDVSDRSTFQGLKNWIQQLKDKGPENIVIVVVGNKIDLLEHQVEVNEAQEYARQENALFKLISVKDNKGIEELFDGLAGQLEKVGVGREGGKVVIGDGGGKGKKRKDKCC